MFFVSPFASEATTRIYIVIIYCTYLMRRKLSLSSGVSFLPKILLLSSFLQKKKVRDVSFFVNKTHNGERDKSKRVVIFCVVTFFLIIEYISHLKNMFAISSSAASSLGQKCQHASCSSRCACARG